MAPLQSNPTLHPATAHPARRQVLDQIYLSTDALPLHAAVAPSLPFVGDRGCCGRLYSSCPTYICISRPCLWLCEPSVFTTFNCPTTYLPTIPIPPIHPSRIITTTIVLLCYYLTTFTLPRFSAVQRYDIHMIQPHSPSLLFLFLFFLLPTSSPPIHRRRPTLHIRRARHHRFFQGSVFRPPISL